ncbi:hypothetical protein DITRI_Ditri15bG0023700 [Diplodiscus trichospermus]
MVKSNNRGMVSWTKPEEGSLKFNVDGSTLGQPGPAGIGGILRDHDSSIKMLFSKLVIRSWDGNLKPFHKTVVVVLVCMTLINCCSATTNHKTQPKFPAIIIFGDSTVDPGNNNYINTTFKANIPPHGIDFPGQLASGRFSDGKLVPDFLASFLGIKDAVPPFLDPNLSDDELRTGVSFASAGSGFDDLTTTLSNVIPVSNAGTNDLLFNFLDLPTRRFEFDSKGYHDFLLQRLGNLVQELYGLGARKIVVAGLPPIGCLPIQMTSRLEFSTNRKCLKDQNSDAQSYNRRLVKLLPKIQSKLAGSKILYADIYQPLIDMINHPQHYGFEDTNIGCCGANGPLVTTFFCNPTTPICRKPSEFIFWDSVHPTQEAYRYIVHYFMKQVVPKLLHA